MPGTIYGPKVCTAVSESFCIAVYDEVFAIPGLRLGFGILAEKAARRLELGKDVWNVNFLAQKAGVAALNDFAYQRQ